MGGKLYIKFLQWHSMKMLSLFHDKQNEEYVVYHSAILTFIITVMIPMNFGFTKLPLPLTGLLLLFGFSSLFMITYNEKVGHALLRSLHVSPKSSSHIESSFEFERKKRESEMLPQSFSKLSNNKTSYKIQDPISTLQSSIKKIMIEHNRNMDKATRSSFSKLDVWLSGFSYVEI